MTVLLKLIDLFRGLYTYLGVDYHQLRAIVSTKLVMDNRRNVVSFGQQKDKEQSNRFWKVILIYGFLGLFIASAILTFPSFVISMTIYHSYVMVMISMTLISDFSSVLMDTSDNTIILPRPVSGRTLAAARITHIFLYLAQMALGLMLAPLLATAYKYGIGTGAVMLITTTLSVLIAVIFTNSVYLLLMQFTSEEKLKTIINYFQIIMAVMMMGAYQVLPRLMGSDLVRQTDLVLARWSLLVPPMWMAGTLDIFHGHVLDALHLELIFLAIAFPWAGFFISNKYLTPLFATKLGDLGTSSAVQETAEKKETGRPSFLQLKRWITTPGLERASYELVATLIARDRKLKLKVYPGIGYVFIMTFVILFQGKHSLTIMFNDLPFSSAHVFLLYASFFVVQIALHEIGYSDEFRAAWIYSSSPIARPGEILSGAWKAVLVKFFLPIYLIFSIFILSVWKIGGLDDVVFAFGNNLFLFLILAQMSGKHFPQSMEGSARKQAGNFARSVLIVVMLGVVGGAHYLLAKIPYGLWFGFPVTLLGTHLLMKGYKDTRWEAIEF